MDGDFFAKLLGTVGVHIAHMAFFSNWGQPPSLGVAGANFSKIFGQAWGRGHAPYGRNRATWTRAVRSKR